MERHPRARFHLDVESAPSWMGLSQPRYLHFSLPLPATLVRHGLKPSGSLRSTGSPWSIRDCTRRPVPSFTARLWCHWPSKKGPLYKSVTARTVAQHPRDPAAVNQISPVGEPNQGDSAHTACRPLFQSSVPFPGPRLGLDRLGYIPRRTNFTSEIFRPEAVSVFLCRLTPL